MGPSALLSFLFFFSFLKEPGHLSAFSKTMFQGSSGAGEGFEVTKYGHGRVALIGFPRFANKFSKSFVCLNVNINLS